MSGRSCSLARNVFFEAVTKPLQRIVDGGKGAGSLEMIGHLLQSRIGMLRHVLLEGVEHLSLESSRLSHFAFEWGNNASISALPLEFIHPPLPHFEPLGDLRVG